MMNHTKREEPDVTRVVKVVQNNDIRRFVLEEDTFQCLVDSVQRSIGVDAKECAIRYEDEDGDVLTISSDPELQEAFRVANRQQKTLRLFVTDPGILEREYQFIAPRGASSANQPTPTPSADIIAGHPDNGKPEAEKLPDEKQDGDQDADQDAKQILLPEAEVPVDVHVAKTHPLEQKQQAETSFEGRQVLGSVHVKDEINSLGDTCDVGTISSEPSAAKPQRTSAPSAKPRSEPNSDKCIRATCLYVKHRNSGNNGGTHCCKACKRSAVAHGGACTRIVVGSPEKKPKCKSPRVPNIATVAKCGAPQPVVPCAAAPDAIAPGVTAPTSVDAKPSKPSCSGCPRQPRQPQCNTETVRWYCDGCDIRITGARFHCFVCPDFDLCATCKANPLASKASNHPPEHAMWEMPVDRRVAVAGACKASACRADARNQASTSAAKGPNVTWKQRNAEWAQRRQEWKAKKKAFVAARRQLNQQIANQASSSSTSSSESDSEVAADADLLRDESIPAEWKQEWKKMVAKKIEQRLAKAECKAAIRKHKAALKDHTLAKKEAKKEWKRQTSEWKKRIKEWKTVARKAAQASPRAAPVQPSAPPSVPSYSNEVATCRSMGFLNDELSRSLIEECKGQMDKVVSALLAIDKIKSNRA